MVFVHEHVTLTILFIRAGTNPQGARGVSLGLLSAAALADLLRDDVQAVELAARLDAWGAAEALPWFLDHLSWDAALLTSWAGQPVEPDGQIGVEALFSAAQYRNPEWMAVLVPYLGMAVMPSALDPLRAAVRRMVREHWQPAQPDGPTRDELAELVRANMAQPVPA